MNTRHVDAISDYPFLPEQKNANTANAIATILDMYMVVRGPHISTGPTSPLATVRLAQVTQLSPGVTQLSILASHSDGRVWEAHVDIDRNVGEPGIRTVFATADISRESYVVLTVNTDALQDSLTVSTDIYIEPSRIAWQIENVSSVSFKNIERCNSVEDEDALVDVVTYDENSPDIKMENGYNTELTYADNNLIINANLELGEGLSPDYGNNIAGSCTAVDPSEIEGIFAINGLLPDNGNIDIETTSGLFLEKTTGLISIQRRDI